MNIKQQIEQEASSLALQLYNVNTELDRVVVEKERLEKRLQELSIALNTTTAIEKELEDVNEEVVTDDNEG